MDITNDTLKSRIYRVGFPGYGHCGCCGMPWSKAEPHVTHYGLVPGVARSGCFPLCEDCWKRLENPEARVPYYKELIYDWEKRTEVLEADKVAIVKAVMAGG